MFSIIEINPSIYPLLFSHDLIRTLVLHLTFHHERGIFCQFILHIAKVQLMNRVVFLGLLDLFTDCLSSYTFKTLVYPDGYRDRSI